MATEQLDLLGTDDERLFLPGDLPALLAWIDEAVARCETEAARRRYPGSDPAAKERAWLIWPHAWVLRDLVAALPEPGDHARLLVDRHARRAVDARQVQALIAAVAGEEAGT